MGIGFVEIRDNETMSGVVAEVSGGLPSDHDWCFKVRPDFASLLVNHKGFRNANGLVECEVTPPARFGVESARSDETFRRYMNALQGMRVVVTGTFVADCWHSYDGSGCIPIPCCDHGKTEIHPITSILVELPPPANVAKRVGVFVFSDSSNDLSRPHHQVCHANESRVGRFREVIGPVAAPGQAVTTSYVTVSEIDQAETHQFAVVQEGSVHVFQGTVVSGTEAQGRGLYYAVFDLLYQLTGKKLTVAPAQVAFAPVEVAHRVTRQLVLRSDGTEPVSLSIAPPPSSSPFEWQPVNTTIAPRASQQVGVTYHPAAIGTHSAVLIVTSNAPGSPHRISLSGQAYDPECPRLQQQIAGLHSRVEELQKELQGAAGAGKSGLIREIRQTQAEAAALERRARTLRCPGVGSDG